MQLDEPCRRHPPEGRPKEGDRDAKQAEHDANAV